MKYFNRSLLAVFLALGGLRPVLAQWIQTGPLGGGGPQVKALAVMGSYVFAGTDSGIFVSSNRGTSWTEGNSGLSDTNVPSLLVSGSRIYSGTHAGVFVSSDRGVDWNVAGSGTIQSTTVAALASNGSDLFAGTFGSGVFLSTDGGNTWTPVNAGLTNLYVFCLAVSNSNLLAGTTVGVFRSTDNGTSWNGIPNGPWGYNVRAFAVSGSNVYAGVDANDGTNSIYRSTDGGATWTMLDGSPSGTTTYAFAVVGTDVFAAGNSAVHASTDNGSTWMEASSSDLVNTIVSSLAVNDTDLFAGTALLPPIGVFRRPLSQMITTVQQEGTGTPRAFSLLQNYPNPFNPTTAIVYDVSVLAHLKLTDYDILGRRVSTLVDGERQPGHYVVTFDASGLPSGVYLYLLRAGNYTDAKKLMYLK